MTKNDARLARGLPSITPGIQRATWRARSLIRLSLLRRSYDSAYARGDLVDPSIAVRSRNATRQSRKFTYIFASFPSAWLGRQFHCGRRGFPQVKYAAMKLLSAEVDDLMKEAAKEQAPFLQMPEGHVLRTSRNVIWLWSIEVPLLTSCFNILSGPAQRSRLEPISLFQIEFCDAARRLVGKIFSAQVHAVL